jgi:hypothetical protein
MSVASRQTASSSFCPPCSGWAADRYASQSVRDILIDDPEPRPSPRAVLTDRHDWLETVCCSRHSRPRLSRGKQTWSRRMPAHHHPVSHTPSPITAGPPKAPNRASPVASGMQPKLLLPQANRMLPPSLGRLTQDPTDLPLSTGRYLPGCSHPIPTPWSADGRLFSLSP